MHNIFSRQCDLQLLRDAALRQVSAPKNRSGAVHLGQTQGARTAMPALFSELQTPQHALNGAWTALSVSTITIQWMLRGVCFEECRLICADKSAGLMSLLVFQRRY